MAKITGDVVSATEWNNVAGFHGALVTNTANSLIGAGADTALAFDTEVYDVGGYITATDNEFTVPAGHAGYYHIVAHVEWDAASGASVRSLWICKPDAVTKQCHDTVDADGAGKYGSNHLDIVLHLDAGDKVYVVVNTSTAETVLSANGGVYFGIWLLNQDELT